MDTVKVPRKELDEHLKRFHREGLSVRSVVPETRDDPHFENYVVTVERRTEIRESA